MPADSDHLRRDALHAARSEARIHVMKYLRRVDSDAKAYIENVLATREGALDGTEIGREAATAAARTWLGVDPTPAIEGATASNTLDSEDPRLRSRDDRRWFRRP